MVMEVYIKFKMVILLQSAMVQCKTSFTRKLRWVAERESHKIVLLYVLFLQGMGRKTDIAARNSRQLAKGAVILALSGTSFLIT